MHARLFRVATANGSEYLVERDGRVCAVDGDIYGSWTDGAVRPQGLRGPNLAPVVPSKIVAVGLNYKAHAAEQGSPCRPSRSSSSSRPPR
jgi:2-keto-4-pentenoate hydratase/2-oxohepta-3-ene-1,7-dioic acid hydratase in catechol pathway